MKLPTYFIGLMLISLGGCASYAPRPLPQHISLPPSAAAVTVEPERLPFHTLSSHPFNPNDGLDMVEVGMLAVANNPQLRQSRDDLNIAQAQAFAAGLLPDPQLGLTSDHPTNGPTGSTTAFNLGVNYNISALLQRSAHTNAAKSDVQRINMELLWQEWQVLSQSRLLFTRLMTQQDSLTQLRAAHTLLNNRYQLSQRALAAGNVTLDFTGADLSAVQNAASRINDLERAQLQNRASLNALLGLRADAPLHLVGEPIPAELDITAIRATLEQRLHQRPDLKALRAAYHSQEEKFRGAVLAQFPALTLGLSRARDTSGLYTLGFALNLSLPIFNANRGNIAIEKASRKKLFDEYQNRLNSAYSEIDVALENIPLIQTQLQRTREGVIQLEALTHHSDVAYRMGNLSAPDYVRLQTALLDKQIEAINLQQASREQRIALETLLGPDLPLKNRSVE